MTGWRVGYLAAPTNVARAISAMQGHTTSNACSFAQYAAVTALRGGEEVIENMKAAFDERRKYICGRLKKINVPFIAPQGAFYVFADISRFKGKTANGVKIEGSMSFASALTDSGVAVIPGLPFHADNFIRLSYAVSMNDIKEGFDRIEEFLKLIK